MAVDDLPVDPKDEPSSHLGGRKHGRAQFWSAFWLVILGLAVITGYSQWKLAHPRVEMKEGVLVVSPEWVDEWHAIAARILEENQISLGEDVRARHGALIGREIDEAFAPVYAQIPKLADFHYSVIGEYTELVGVLNGSQGESLQRILFENAGFEAGIAESSNRINDEFVSILGGAISGMRRNIDAAPDLTEEERAVLTDGLRLSEAAVQVRFANELVALRAGGAGVGGALVAGKAAGKKAAGALAKKVAAKASAKAAAKSLTPAAAAMGGGILCAGLGPIAMAACGVGAATAVWLATDAVIVTVDEAINREEFEAEVRGIVDEQRELIKASLAKEYDSLFALISEDVDQRVRATTPAEAVQQGL